MNHRSIHHRLALFLRRAASVIAAAFALAVPAAIPATAHADGSPTATIVPSAQTRPLGLSGFGAIVADDATRSVFLSSGPGGDGVEEVGYDGAVIGTIGHEEGADGMALSADGSTLYVALATGDAVSAIDPGTLAEKARYPLPPHSCPTNLARIGPDVWIGYGCGHGVGGLAVLATDAASPRVILARQAPTSDARYSAAPIVAASMQSPGTLVVSQPSTNPTIVTTYTASAGAQPSLQLVATATLGGSELADLAVSPEGATVFAASGSQTTADALSTATLARSAQYTTGLGPDAVAVSPDGTKIASTTAIPGSHVYVWRIDDGSGSPSSDRNARPSSRPEGDYGRPGSGAPAPRGLAFSGDGRLLFFVTEPPSGQGGPTLTVLEVDED